MEKKVVVSSVFADFTSLGPAAVAAADFFPRPFVALCDANVVILHSEGNEARSVPVALGAEASLQGLFADERSPRTNICLSTACRPKIFN
ncbi:hypothetical protein AAC387_Pa09g0311 [Persea americana]